MKKVIVFGTTHQPQFLGDKLNSELANRLLLLSDRFGTSVFMEEWKYDGSKSFLQQLAEEKKVDYSNVGTGPEKVFETATGPINYPGHNGTLGYVPDGPSMYEYGPLLNHENREKRMRDNIQQIMASHTSGIFIVGMAHVHSMSFKLIDSDYEVLSFCWLP